jgi:hypothetical protein
MRSKFNDLQQWRMKMMAAYGGFSHRFIAKAVLGDEERHASVASWLHRMGVKVTDWRNGKIHQAKEHADSITHPKHRRKQRKAS